MIKKIDENKFKMIVHRVGFWSKTYCEVWPTKRMKTTSDDGKVTCKKCLNKIK